MADIGGIAGHLLVVVAPGAAVGETAAEAGYCGAGAIYYRTKGHTDALAFDYAAAAATTVVVVSLESLSSPHRYSAWEAFAGVVIGVVVAVEDDGED